MPTGTIEWFSSRRGFGFITPDGGGDEVFLRSSEITALTSEALTPGVRVVYDVDLTSGDLEARRIQAI